jgi:hypothetical protein
MKKILIVAGLLIGTLAWAEPHGLDVIAQTNNPHPSHSAHKGSTTETVVDDVLTIILDQGFAGALILILFVWTFRTDKANRASQKENFDKFVEISSECSGHMAAVSARLENIERELEQAKQLEMLTASRKG